MKLRTLFSATLIVAAAAIAGLAPIDALAQAAAPAAPTTVNFSPFVSDVLLPALGTIVTGAIVYAVQRWIGIQLDARAVATVNDVLQKGLAFAQAKVGGNALEVNVGSPVIAMAASYALQHGPDALKRLGVSPEQLAEKLVARWHDPSVPVGVTGTIGVISNTAPA